jgi:hypothetical protein
MESIPIASNGSAQVFIAWNRSCCEVTCRNLRLHLNLGIWWDHLVGNRTTFQDLNKGVSKTIVSLPTSGAQQIQYTIDHTIAMFLCLYSYLDARVDNGVVLHVRHGHESVNLRNTKPMKDIRHECLESHIL